VFSLSHRCIRERLGNLARVVTQFSTTIIATRQIQIADMVSHTVSSLF